MANAPKSGAIPLSMISNPAAHADPLAGHELIVFGADWGRHPTPSQHLIRCFLPASKVLWVETVGLRNPALSLRDLRRSMQKIADFSSRRREQTPTEFPNLRITCPPTLPFTRSALVRKFNQWQVSRAVRRITREMGFDRPALVLTAPSQADYVGHLGEGVSIYYCMDQYALWDGMDAEHVERMEADLVRRVSGIVAVSEFLAKRMAASGKPVRILTQGVDAGHFRPASKTAAPGRFEIVYFGMIDDRVDQPLLVKAARALPKAVFRLIGPETVPTDELRAEPNIVLEGPVDYAQLPLAVLTAGAFVLPFQMSDLSKSCSPVKLKEYLACGRPVVTTAMPEALLMKDHLRIARDHDEFVALLEKASQGALPVSSEDVGRFLDSESWQGKAEALAKFIEELRGL